MIPPKYFYDAAGSRLFDAITELPEYYLTRTEVALLQRARGYLHTFVAGTEIVSNDEHTGAMPGQLIRH